MALRDRRNRNEQTQNEEHEIRYKNLIEAQGVVVYVGLDTTRRSNIMDLAMPDIDGQRNSIRFIINDISLADDVRIGDFVRITGEVYSAPVMNMFQRPDERRMNFVTSYIITTVEKIETAADRAFKDFFDDYDIRRRHGREYDPPFFRAMLAGVVVSESQTNRRDRFGEWHSLVVKVGEDRRGRNTYPVNIRVQYHVDRSSTSRGRFVYQRGDEICLTAYMYTTLRTEERDRMDVLSVSEIFPLRLGVRETENDLVAALREEQEQTDATAVRRSELVEADLAEALTEEQAESEAASADAETTDAAAVPETAQNTEATIPVTF